MSKKLLLSVALLVLLMGCGGAETVAEESPYQLYFGASSTTFYGSAIVGEDYAYEGDDAPSINTLVRELLKGPTDETLVNPFPAGTSLSWTEYLGNGVVRINLSEEYSGLTGISLTLADYCIVYTVTQLEGVTGVEILSGGQWNPYRDHQILQVSDVRTKY